MKRFKVAVEYKSWGRIIVEAEDKEDLLRKLKNDEFVDELPLPYEPEYVYGSYAIDWDSTSLEPID